MVIKPSCSSTHLKRKRWLLIVDPDKDLPNYQLFAVIIEHKLCTKAFIILSLQRETIEKMHEYLIVFFYSDIVYQCLFSSIYLISELKLDMPLVVMYCLCEQFNKVWKIIQYIYVIPTLLMFPSC